MTGHPRDDRRVRRTKNLLRALTPALVARQITSTFLLTLEWWIDLPQPRPARDADEVFRLLARPVLEAFRDD